MNTTRIDTVNINLTLAAPAPGFPPFLAALVARATAAPAGEDAATTAPASALTPPKIGEVWPGQGGIYAGISRGEDGAPDAHLILSTDRPSGKLQWQAGLDWAKTVRTDDHEDFHVPTRFESALLYAHLRDQHDTDSWHWTSTQCSDSNAWNQYFNNGVQNYGVKKFEGAVRAVRRFVA
jgi:hypothetical protein